MPSLLWRPQRRSPVKSASPTPIIPQSTTFNRLPTEIHLCIARVLSYPDALALKHTNRYFYSLVRTDLSLRIDWILARHKQGLVTPRTTTVLDTDELFCKGEINVIMQRRRRHFDCRFGPGGCAVVERANCGGQPGRALRMVMSLDRKEIPVEFQFLLYGFLVVCGLTLIYELLLMEES